MEQAYTEYNQERIDSLNKRKVKMEQMLTKVKWFQFLKVKRIKILLLQIYFDISVDCVNKLVTENQFNRIDYLYQENKEMEHLINQIFETLGDGNYSRGRIKYLDIFGLYKEPQVELYYTSGSFARIAVDYITYLEQKIDK